MTKVNLEALKLNLPKEDTFIDNLLIIKRDFRLIQLFLPKQIGGFTIFFDKKTRKYMFMLVRLIDKSILNYNLIIQHIQKLEKNTKLDIKDFLMVTDYAEDCILPLSRSIKIIESIVKDNSTNLKDFTKIELLEEIKDNQNIINVRNRIEHISEDILKDELKDGEHYIIYLDNKKLSVGKSGTSIELSEIKVVLEKYNNMIVNVLSELPDKHTEKEDAFYKNGIIYDKKRFD